MESAKENYTMCGSDVEIEEGAIIGEKGFRYNKQEDGTLKELPHWNGIDIGDNVRIRTGCVIDQGRYRDTVIGDGTKIDVNSHIAHNAIIGKNCLIHAFVNICGSVEIGDRCEIFPFCNIQPLVKICNDVTIGDGSIVRENIIESGTYVYAGNGKMRKIK